MASLNLSPNPTIMLVQAGIFAVNFFAIKKLYLEPYLKVSDRRDSLTLGSKEEAQNIERKNQAATNKITSEIAKARDDAAMARQELASEANRRKSEILTAAEHEASSLVDRVRSDIKNEISVHKAKLPTIVQELTDEIYRLMVQT